jgi:hypothetical protein
MKVRLPLFSYKVINNAIRIKLAVYYMQANSPFMSIF